MRELSCTLIRSLETAISTKGEEYWRHNVDSVELRTTLIGLDMWRFYIALPGSLLPLRALFRAAELWRWEPHARGLGVVSAANQSNM
jgi:hypothetical protein